MPTIRTLFLLFLAAGVATAPAVADETRETIRERMKKRLPLLQQYKDKGKVGETHLGFVAAVKQDALKDETLKKTVEAENADRRALYRLIAREQSTNEKPVTADQVGRQNAVLKFKKAAGHEYFRGKDGRWRTKKEMLEEAEKEETA